MRDIRGVPIRFYTCAIQYQVMCSFDTVIKGQLNVESNDDQILTNAFILIIFGHLNFKNVLRLNIITKTYLFCMMSMSSNGKRSIVFTLGIGTDTPEQTVLIVLWCLTFVYTVCKDLLLRHSALIG